MSFSVSRSKRLMLQLQLWVIYFEKKNLIVFLTKDKSVTEEIFIYLMVVTMFYCIRQAGNPTLKLEQSCLPSWLTGLGRAFKCLSVCLSCCIYAKKLITCINETLVLLVLAEVWINAIMQGSQNSLLYTQRNGERFQFDPEESASIQENSFIVRWRGVSFKTFTEAFVL